jgi:hypothetical protein
VAVAASVEVPREQVVAVVVHQVVELMVLQVLLEQLEQGGRAFHLQFLAIMEETPKCMARVEMVEQIELTLLERALQ